MEVGDHEPVSQCLLSAGSKPEDLALAHLVGEGLSGHPYVAVDFLLDDRKGDRSPFHEPIDRPLPAPAHVMHAGVDHQTTGPPGVRAEHAEAVHVR